MEGFKIKKAKREHAEFLLVGGGLASATAAETLRMEGASGSITMLCAESLPPYHRPPLSKLFLSEIGEHSPSFVHSDAFYRKNRIKLRLNTRATTVDTTTQTVFTAAGDEIGYDHLLIATGATPKIPAVPGITLDGVFTLRNIADAAAISQAAKQAKHVVILGGSFLGMEVAFSLKKRGLQVTAIQRHPSLLEHLNSPELSAHFQDFAERQGVSVVLNDIAARVLGNHCVQEIETASGRRIPCDLAVVGIGVVPASDFLASSGIELRDGWIVVDSLLRTNVPNVFAAGDITIFHDPAFDRLRHIEHWDNAVKQGRLAAKNMLGRRLPYDEISYFYCDLGDIGFNVLGATEDAQARIVRGSMRDRSCAMFYVKNDVLRGLFSTGRPTNETRVAEDLIRSRHKLRAIKDKLADPAFILDGIPTQTALILQGGGALGAFECGVVRALEESAIFPDIVAGVSIGAFNGAIIASNPRRATEALEAFWEELKVVTPLFGPFWNPNHLATMNILTFGVPKFFRPRCLSLPLGLPQFLSSATSFYNIEPMRDLIAKYVDFPRLRNSPVRLLISAVNVESAELEVFDSFVDDLTPDHVLASGSLPPGFPWTEINGKAYWDGGIFSNSPLDLLVERCGPDGKRVFIVDLFGGTKQLPANLVEVMMRRDEIIYSERVRSDLRHREAVDSYRKLIRDILTHVDPSDIEKLKRQPRFIALMGDSATTSITRFVRPAQRRGHDFHNFDFSDRAIAANIAEGYSVAMNTLSPR